MKNHGYIIIAAMLAAAASCTGNLTDGPGMQITFRAGIETRAFMNSGELNVAGNEMAIYGYEDSNALINGVKSSYGAEGWTLGEDYYWADGKSYAFFSYLTKDKDGHTAPTGLTISGRTLTHPVREFDFDGRDNNFDFCYSDVVYRPSDRIDHSVVNLNLKHLYTAIAFSAHNYTGSAIAVKEVSLCGLKNSKSASINFADTGAEVTYGDASCTWPIPSQGNVGSRKLNSSIITLNPGAECADIVGTASLTPCYYMFWPQTSGELTAEVWSDSSSQPSGGAYLKVVYEKNGSEVTRYARFPQEKDGIGGWPAGTKRMMQLAFRDDQFTLKVAAMPWEYSEPTIKYDEEVEVVESLHFDSATCTVDEANHKVYFNGANPVTGSFRLSSPSGATWTVSKEGDYDAFEIDNVDIGIYGDGLDRNYGSVDVVAGNSFTLYPRNVAAGRDYSIQLTFSVRYSDGESYCIDGKLQPAGRWTIILSR